MDYLGNNTISRLIANPPVYCADFNFAAIKSLRYIGTEDTSTQAISFFRGTSSNPASWKEVVVTTPALNQFGFQPIYAITQGNSNWTLYLDETFAGNSTCFIATGTSGWNAISLVNLPVHSVLKGCDTRPIDKYVYGDDVIE
jgi:hypothetical protein